MHCQPIKFDIRTRENICHKENNPYKIDQKTYNNFRIKSKMWFFFIETYT